MGFFFNIYSAALYKSGFKITFKRNNNDDVTCHVWGNGKPIKVVIESMCNRMPIIKYDPITEVDMKSNLIKHRKQLIFRGVKQLEYLSLEVILISILQTHLFLGSLMCQIAL